VQTLWISRFNRLCIVIFAAWAIYCLFVRPIVLARQGTEHYRSASLDCINLFPLGPDQDKCIADEKFEFESGLMTGFDRKYETPGRGWSYAWYFRTQGWWVIAMILIPSLVIYGSLRGVIWTASWIWG